jgi:glutamine amidotransferase
VDAAAGPARVTETVAIIDYGSGNLRSAAKAFERMSRETGTGAAIIVTADAEAVRRADRIVLPGVGAFADCRAGLDAVPGMVEALEERVIADGVPFLGICVGMQLMASEGREKTVTKGLGWIPGAVVRIEPEGNLKVPHMGWNTLSSYRAHPLLAGIPDGPQGLHAYFVHSYHLAVGDKAMLIATADYGQEVTAIVGRDNMLGTQFHPEKSQALGLALIGNFLSWTP